MKLEELTNAQLMELLRQTEASPEQQRAPNVSQEGAGFMDRLGMAFKMNDVERANYLKSRYGAENVANTPDGRIAYRKSPRDQWTVADPKGLDWGDTADIAAAVPEAIGGALGAVAGAAAGLVGGPAAPATVPLAAAGGAAIGSGAGNVVKQSIGALLPGANTASAGERLGEAGFSTALGGAIPAIPLVGRALKSGVGAVANRVADVASDVGGRVLPGPTIGRAQREALNTPVDVLEAARTPRQLDAAGLSPEDLNFMRSGEEIERRVADLAGPGAPEFRLTASQLTNNQNVGMLEDFARTSRTTADKYWTAYRNNVKAADTALGNLAKQAGPETSPGELAGAIADAMKQFDKELLELRSTRAAADYAKAEALGDIPVVKPEGLRRHLMKLKREGTDSMGNMDATAAYAAAELKRLPRQMTARDINIFTKRYGSVGYGSGDNTFLADLGLSDRTKLSRTFFGELNNDIDRAILKNPPYGKANEALKAVHTAKQNFKEATTQAEKLRETAVSRVVENYTGKGASLDKLPEALMRMSPSEIRETMAFFRTAKPEVADKVQRFVLDRARQLGKQGVKVQGTVETSLPDLAKALPSGEHLVAFFDDGGKIAAKDVEAIRQALRRMQMRSFGGESPTNPRERVAGGIMNMARGAAESVNANRIAEATLRRREPLLVSKPPLTLEDILADAKPGALARRSAGYGTVQELAD